MTHVDDGDRQPARLLAPGRRAGRASTGPAARPASGSRSSVAAPPGSWRWRTPRCASAPATARPTRSRPPSSRSAARYDRVVAITRSGTTTEVLDLLDALDGDADHRARRRRRRTPAARAGRRDAVALPLRRRAVGRADPLRHQRPRPAARPPRRGHRRRRRRRRGAPSGCRCRSTRRRSSRSPSSAAAGPSGSPQEAALKCREAATFWAEAYPAMDYRHGPISIAAPGPGGLGVRRGPGRPGRGRGGDRRGVRARPAPRRLRRAGQLVRRPHPARPDGRPDRRAALRGALAASQGLDPDRPRNLTRSVVLRMTRDARRRRPRRRRHRHEVRAGRGRTARCSTPSGTPPAPRAARRRCVETILDVAAGLAGKARADGLDPVAAGVAVPGVVDEATGVAVWSANVGFRDVPLRDLVADAARPARGARPRRARRRPRRGPARRRARTSGTCSSSPIGTGIAAAHVVDGRAFAGAHGAAGEIGHIVVRPGGAALRLRRRAAAWRRWPPPSAIGRRYAELAGVPATGAPRSPPARPPATPLADRGLARGRRGARRRAAHRAGALRRRRSIVLGGGLAEAGEALLAPLRAALRRAAHASTGCRGSSAPRSATRPAASARPCSPWTAGASHDRGSSGRDASTPGAASCDGARRGRRPSGSSAVDRRRPGARRRQWIVPGLRRHAQPRRRRAHVHHRRRRAARAAAAFHLRHGTTTLLASLVSSPFELMRDATAAYAAAGRRGRARRHPLRGAVPVARPAAARRTRRTCATRPSTS